eukprot:6012455-Prymnesium_polylepis.1
MPLSAARCGSDEASMAEVTRMKLASGWPPYTKYLACTAVVSATRHSKVAPTAARPSSVQSVASWRNVSQAGVPNGRMAPTSTPPLAQPTTST